MKKNFVLSEAHAAMESALMVRCEVCGNAGMKLINVNGAQLVRCVRCDHRQPIVLPARGARHRDGWAEALDAVAGEVRKP